MCTKAMTYHANRVHDGLNIIMSVYKYLVYLFLEDFKTLLQLSPSPLAGYCMVTSAIFKRDRAIDGICVHWHMINPNKTRSP